MMLHVPTFVINLDRCPERLETALKRLADAGFTNVRRFAAFDGKLPLPWTAVFGEIPKMHDELKSSAGAQGCLLSHFKIWQTIVDQQIPVVNMFEDDGKFHPRWHELRQICLKATPQDFDLLYYGCTFFKLRPEPVVSLPAHGTIAYCITLNGARRLLDLYRRANPLHTVDGMLIHMQMRNPTYIKWYNWNVLDPAWNLERHADGYARAYGLVKQDESVQSTIR